MSATAGGRHRLVTVQNGREHVSAVVLGPDEVSDHLHIEACLHQAAGWVVYEEPGVRVVATRAHVTREITARNFNPMEDH